MSYLLGNITLFAILIIFTFIYNVFFFGVVSLFFYKHIKNSKKIFFKIIPFTFLIILIVNSIGWISWRLLIEDKLVNEVDPLITSLPYKPLATSYFADTDIFYYEPVSPLINLIQVSRIWYGFAISQITIACILCLSFVFIKYKECKYLLFVVLVFLLQFLYLGIKSFDVLFGDYVVYSPEKLIF